MTDIVASSSAEIIADPARRVALLDYWECKIDTTELVERLKPV